MLDERGREAVALVDELLEDRPALSQEHREPRQRSSEDDDDDRVPAAHQLTADETSAGTGRTSAKRYAVVSCHVERPLDDALWARFSALQRRRPGGFTIAALLRPADTTAGENEDTWIERAREAAARGPLGHHIHYTAPAHARPSAAGAAERVRAEGLRFRELGLAPTLFCGGGWYTDAEVADVCAELGYVDCTPRPKRPSYLSATERWASLALPARLRLPSQRRLTAIPTTHSLRELSRAVWRPSLPPFVHVYLHDTDLASSALAARTAARRARAPRPGDGSRHTCRLAGRRPARARLGGRRAPMKRSSARSKLPPW